MKNLVNIEKYAIGFLLGTAVTLIMLYFVNPTFNTPCIQEHIVDTVYIDTITAKATYYNPVKAQTDNTPTITSDGTKLNKNSKSVAISRDLQKKLPFGSKIKLIYPKHLSGIYVVNDLLNKRYKQRVDIMVWRGKIKVDTIKFIKV